MNEVQVQDKGQIEAKAALDGELAGISSEKELLRFFNDHPEYRKEYFDACADGKEQEWIEKHTTKAPAPEGEQAETEPEAEQKAEPEAEPKAGEKVPEPAKAKEPEPVTKKLESQLTQLENEVVPELQANLQHEKAQREALEKQIQELQKTAKAEGIRTEKRVLPKIEIPTVGDDEDLLSESGQKKVRQMFSALPKIMEQNEAQRATIDELQQKVQGVQSKVVETSTKVETANFTAQKSREESHEYEMVDKLRQDHPEFFGEFTRPTEEIERDYIGFLEEVSRKSGITGSIYSAEGLIRPEVMRAAKLYGEDNEQGKRLKEACRKEYPADYDVLQKVYEVRGVRFQYQHVDPTGKAKPMEYEEAFPLFLSRNPTVAQEMQKDAVKKAHVSHERAVANREAFAKETPANAGSAPFDVAKFPDAEGMALLDKKPSERKSEEKQKLEQWMVMKGLPKEEARFHAYGRET